MHKQKVIKLSLPLLSECVVSARLTAGVVCSILKLDIDESEDVKLCVSEACNVLLNQNFCTAEITFGFGDGLRLELAGTDCRGEAKESKSANEMSVMLLSALADNVQFFESGGIISKISFTKEITGGRA